MSNQYLRKYTLYISGPKYKVYEGDTEAQTAREITDPLRIKFSITKTILRDPNLAEITLYNLSPDTEREIIQEGTQVVLSAGYVDNESIIFKGQVFQALRGKENSTDYFLKLICLDGDAYLNLAFVSGTITPNNTRQQIAQQILRDSSIELDSIIVDSLPNTNFIDGSTSTNERAKVVFGDPSRYLDSMSRMGNSSFYIDNNEAKFFDPLSNEGKTEAHLISVETGLVGLPQQVDYGIEFKCLLNPNIKLGDFIKIDNKIVLQQQFNFGEIPYLLDADGIYRIIKISYSGDSRGQEWYSSINAITQGGVIPSMLIGQQGNLIL